MAQAKKEPGNAVVAWKERMAQIAAQAVEAEKPAGGWLSFKGGRLTYNDQMIPGDKIQCVIVDAMLENSYYNGPYDANKTVSPVCFAFGRREADMIPHTDAEDQQSTSCADCPNNDWGSDPNGGRGKACKNTRRLAIIAADALAKGAEGINKADIVFAKLPVTSVRNFSTFVNQVAVLGVPPFGVVCEMSVVPDNKTMFQVLFKAIKQIEGEDLLSALVAKNMVAEQKLSQPYIKNSELQAGAAPAPAANRKYGA